MMRSVERSASEMGEHEAGKHTAASPQRRRTPSPAAERRVDVNTTGDDDDRPKTERGSESGEDDTEFDRIAFSQSVDESAVSMAAARHWGGHWIGIYFFPVRTLTVGRVAFAPAQMGALATPTAAPLQRDLARLHRGVASAVSCANKNTIIPCSIH